MTWGSGYSTTTRQPQRRIIAAYTLNNPRVMRLEPPLVIEEELLDRVLTALSESVQHTMDLLQDVPSEG